MNCPYCTSQDIAVEGVRDDLHLQCNVCGYYWQLEDTVESIFSYEFVFEDGHNFDLQGISRAEVERQVKELELNGQPIVAVIEHEIPRYDWPDEITVGLIGTDD